MGVVPFKPTATAPESAAWAWDAAAQNAILDADGHEKERDNWALYKAAHTWVDTSDSALPEQKAPYSLPHHHLASDGKSLEAVWDGVVAAMARLKQTDMSEGDLKGAYDHLAAHYAQWGKEPPKWERVLVQAKVRAQLAAAVAPARALRESARVASPRPQPRAGSQHGHGAPLASVGFPMMTTRADILGAGGGAGGMGTVAAVADGSAPLAGGTPTPEMLALINARARTPMSASDVYVFPAQISNQNVDSFWTRMTSLSLQWFAQDATRGVALCDSHVHNRLPIGRSFYGVVASHVELGAAVMATQSLAYVLRGWALSNGLNSDDLIRGIEAGIYWQVSIGFDPVAFHCSVCGRNMLTDWACCHIPGFIYPVPDAASGRDVAVGMPALPASGGPYGGYDDDCCGPDDGPGGYMPPLGMAASPEDALYPAEGTVVCIADVDAHLIEYSPVFRHATPDAEVPTGPNGGSGPNAMMLKAEAEAERGRANPRLLMAVEDRCQTRLFDRWSGFGPGVASGALAGRAIPGRPDAGGPLAPRANLYDSPAAQYAPAYSAAGSLPAAEGDDEMRGSEYIREWVASYTRAGRELSADNLHELASMAGTMQHGHDTMREGIDMLTAWLAEKGGTAADAESNAAKLAATAGDAENAAAIAESTANGTTGGSNQDALDAIQASMGGRSGTTGRIQRAGGAAKDAKKPKVSPEDAAVDKAIAAVQKALSGLKAAQEEDEDAEGANVSPEDAAVDAAIKAAFAALDAIESAQAKDEASDPTDDRARASRPARARKQKADDEAGDEDEQDSTDEDEGVEPIDPDDPDCEDDPDEQEDESGQGTNGQRAGRRLDFDTHKTMTGKHAHGKFDTHEHAGDADHSDAPLRDGPDADAEDEGDDSERIDTGVEPEDPDKHDMGGDPTRDRRAAARHALGARANPARGAAGARRPRAPRALLEVGRQSRARARHAARGGGGRAPGGAGDPEKYRPVLEKASFAEVRALTDDWQRAARLSLAPVGQFDRDTGAAGGGHWDAAPGGPGYGQTMRQTLARNTNDPLGVIAAGARGTPRAGTSPLAQAAVRTKSGQPVRGAQDVSLYTVSGTRPNGARGGNGKRSGKRR